MMDYCDAIAATAVNLHTNEIPNHHSVIYICSRYAALALIDCTRWPLSMQRHYYNLCVAYE